MGEQGGGGTTRKKSISRKNAKRLTYMASPPKMAQNDSGFSFAFVSGHELIYGGGGQNWGVTNAFSHRIILHCVKNAIRECQH
jgi:hypothetical protein